MRSVRERLARRGLPRPGDDEGAAASVFVVMIAIVLLAMAGLVFDGGSAMNQRAKAADDAEQAARAGAAHVDVLALRDTGAVTLDQGAAADATVAYLHGLGYTDAMIRPPVVTGTTVTVAVDTTYRTKLLTVVGINDFPVKAQATARVATGIDAETPP